EARYAYDRAGRMVRKTDRQGYSFHYVYDAEGRCIESHGDGGLYRVALRYEKGRTLVTEADSGTWAFVHDENGTLTAIVDPYGGKRKRIVDDEGNVMREVGPGARTLTYLYDAAGKHTGLEDRFGYIYPPRDEMPDPPSPLAHHVPETALAQ